MKKILSLILSLVMVFSVLSLTAIISQISVSAATDISVLNNYIEKSKKVTVKDFSDENLEKLRDIYKRALVLSADEYAAQTDVDAVVAEFETLFAVQYKEVVIPAVDYITTEPNYQYGYDAYRFYDDGIRLTDGVTSSANGSSSVYAAWGEGINVEVTLDYGAAVDSGKYVAYFTGDEWGIAAPTTMKIMYSNDEINWTTVEGELVTEMLVDGTGKTDNGDGTFTSDGIWSQYKYTVTSDKIINARYIKFEIDPTGLFVWLAEVQAINIIGSQADKDYVYVTDVNKRVTSGSCIIFTPDMGELNTSNANYVWTSNVIAKWNSEYNCYVVNRIVNGTGPETTPKITLADDEIMISAHNWEHGVTDNPVIGSGYNKQLVSNAKINQKVALYGIDIENNSVNIAPYIRFEYLDCDSVGHYPGELVVEKEPTPASEGVKSATCFACGEKITQTIPKIQQLAFSSATLTLEDDISVNYKVDAKFLTQTGYSNPYVKFNLNGVETVVTNYTEENGKLTFDLTDIAPHQIGDTIIATVYATYNGVEYASQPKEYSVATYCYNILNQYNTDEYADLRTLLVDLLIYGEKSQIYVDHNTDNLVTANLTQEQLAWATTTDRQLTTVQKTKFTKVDNPSVLWKGAGLNLQESVAIRFNIAAEDIEGVYVKVISDVGEWIIPSEEFLQHESGYFVFFKGHNVGQMGKTLFATAYKGDTAVSHTIRYSIESYAFAKQNDDDVKLAELIKAMIRYGDSAKTYVGESEPVITNIALNKNYTVSGCGTGLIVTTGDWPCSYNADLTDGIALDKKTYDNQWFAFSKTAGDEGLNIVDGVGTITIDLGKSMDIRGVKANIFANNPSSDGVGVPKSIMASVSNDGKTFGNAVELTVTDTTDVAWASADAEFFGRYVKIEFTMSDNWAPFIFLNEIQVLGVELN